MAHSFEAVDTRAERVGDNRLIVNSVNMWLEKEVCQGDN